MRLDEMVTLFIDSRKRGMTGARKRCTPATLKIYTLCLAHLVDFLKSEVKEGGITRYEELRRAHMLQFMDWLDAKKWAKASVYQVLRCVRTFFRWVDKDEDCRLQKLEGYQRWLPAIPKNPRRLDIPANDVLRKFRNNFNTADRWEYRDYVAISLIMTNGMRIGELCNLEVRNILWGEHILYITGKTNLDEARGVPTTMEMLKLLKGWLKRREGCEYAKNSPYVFVSKRADRMSPNGFGQSFRKHCLKYNLPRVSAHTFRHAFITGYLRQGGDLVKLKEITGHRTLEQLLEYTHLAKLGGKSAQVELEKVNLLKEVG